MTSLARRMVGASLLRQRTYEEVEADRSATPQALLVVLVASLGAGVGWIGPDLENLGSILLLTLVAAMGWVVWAVLTYLIGTHLLPEPQTKADTGELLRTLGFSPSPAVLLGLGAVPGLGPVVTAVVAAWTLATMVVAVRQALDYQSTLRAIAVCITGWGLAFTVFLVIGVFFPSPVS